MEFTERPISMKIFYINELINNSNGARVHGRELIEALRQNGEEVIVYPNIATDDNIPRAKQPKGIISCLEQWPNILETCILFKKCIHAFSIIKRILAALHRERPDVIMIRPGRNDILSIILRPFIRIPIALEVNAPLFEERLMFYRMNGVDVKLWRIFDALERCSWRCSQGIYVVSREIEAFVRRREPRAPHNIRSIPNGVNVDKFNGIRLAHNNSKGDVTITFVGSFHPWHGIEVLLQATRLILVRHPMLRFVLIGDGAERRVLENQVNDDQLLKGRVMFTGFLSHQSVIKGLLDADILVAPYNFPSEFYFSPLKVFEYMAAGKAIIASDCGQIRELLMNGVDALLVPAGNEAALAQAIASLVEDSTLRERLGQNALSKATSHTWLQTARELSGFLAQFCH